jgi:hypothetical protein
MNILSKGASLKALSVAGAYPWLLASGKKGIELRIWGEKAHRGLTLLHSSSGSEFEQSFEDYKLTREQCPKFSIVGCAVLVDVICYDSRQKWERDVDRHLWDEDYEVVLGCYDGRFPYGHVFEKSLLFKKPVLDVPGKYRYWEAANERQKIGFEKATELLKASGYLN